MYFNKGCWLTGIPPGRKWVSTTTSHHSQIKKKKKFRWFNCVHGFAHPKLLTQTLQRLSHRIWILNKTLCSCLENPMDRGAWWAAVYGVAQSRTRLSDFIFTFHFHALEKEMAAHSSVLAWRIPGTGEPGGLLSMGSPRVGHDWRNLAAAAAADFGHWIVGEVMCPLTASVLSPVKWIC